MYIINFITPNFIVNIKLIQDYTIFLLYSMFFKTDNLLLFIELFFN